MPRSTLTTISVEQLAHALGENLAEEGTPEAAQALVALPKADVHCHALLNCPLSSYEAVLGHKLPPPPAYFRDFGEFGGYLAANLFPAIRSIDAIRALLRAGLERSAAEGVRYLEASIDLLLPMHVRASAEDLFAVIAEEKERIAPRLLFAPEIGINRRVPPERLWPLFESFVGSGVFSSIDLYDDERAGRLREFVRFYGCARDRGLLLKAHAGETCQVDRVRETLDVLEVDVLQHGIAVAEDARLLGELARRGTQLNLCPTSNIALGVAASYEDHAIHALLAAGVNVALGTDDYTLFGASLCDEIRQLRRCGMSLEDLARIRLAPPAR